MAIAEAPSLSRPVVDVAAKARSVPSARLDYLDALKVVLTVLVIAHHAGQPYGPTGGRWPIFDPRQSPLLGPFFGVNAAFFMGLFFLISAYFVPASFDRKGVWTFLTDRFLRLGIPLAVVGLTIGALTNATFDPAHLWFVAHLLVYAILYAVWRGLHVPHLALPTPGNRAILGYALILAGTTAAVRLAGFPQDRWITVLGIVPIEVAHLPQYASLFVIGILAARNGWLAQLPRRTGMIWLGIGFVLGVARYVYTPDRVVWSVWESFICVGLCVGLPVLFREYAPTPGRLLRDMAPNAYAAYVFHVMPVVVGLQYALAPVNMDPFLKFTLVTLAGVPLSFVLASALRRIPGSRAIL